VSIIQRSEKSFFKPEAMDVDELNHYGVTEYSSQSRLVGQGMIW
jgi:hypothetical protein